MRVGAKGIGGNYVAPRLDVLALDARDHIGIGKIEELRKGARLHARRLQHGAHATVEQQMFLAAQHSAQVLVAAQGFNRSRRVGCPFASCVVDGCGERMAVGVGGFERVFHE